jgi:hypothetical protein
MNARPEDSGEKTNQGRGGEYSPMPPLLRSSHLSGSPPSHQFLTCGHSKADQCDQSRKPIPLESMYVSYVGAPVTLVNCASMKGSAKRSRTRWTFIMKLSEATVAGSTSKSVREGHERHQSAVQHTCIPALFKLRETAREKYDSTASRHSGDARTIELKI